LACLPALAQVPTQGERDRALSSLHGSAKLFRDAVAGLSKQQMMWKPSPESWSVAEVAEHLALVEEGLLKAASVDVLKTPATPEKRAELRKKDELILKNVPQRTTKAQSPEAFQPSGRFKTTAESVAAFNANREKTVAFISTTQAPLRDHILPHPALGDMDGYQWVLFVGAHCERHVDQIRAVKSNAGFPKK
jgi:hypothetical protein